MGVTCNGRGQGDGGHCCYIAGEVCQFLFTDRGGTPRCGVWDEMDTDGWQAAPVGVWFAENYPGYTCKDWPQNIPEVMAQAETAGPFYVCCWGRGNH